jgi:3-oxoacyl-(acyl-carrier-protein) synthase/acyl carrier protein
MKETDIAIIGMSGIFPEADDLAAFYKNLCTGRDSIRDIPAERRAISRMPPGDYQVTGVLDRIDLFDPGYFGILKSEADCIDPHHRIALQLACLAVENAGYPVSSLKGSATGMCMATTNPGYRDLFSVVNNIRATGIMPSNITGRISHALDLRGPGMVIDNSCSSSLVAIAQACNELILGNADLMLAGGVNLTIAFPEKGQDEMGISAADGRSKSFSDAADGTGWGEGGGMLLLKKAGKAYEDGDIIHAIIKSYSYNHNGRRTIGISAPSWEAQAESISRTLEKGGIDPLQIGYVEAHGTGTLIGDPIEMQALRNAFSAFTGEKQYCAIGSVKTNIGHLNIAAGIAAVIKMVLSLKYGKKFPSLHFKKPNPHIDFASSPFYVNTILQDWPEEQRTGLVSSTGINGSNANMLLTSALPAETTRLSLRAGQSVGPQLLKVSAKSRKALVRCMTSVSHYLKTTADHLPDVCYTLNAGRDDHKHRVIVGGSSKMDLCAQLEKMQEMAGAGDNSCTDKKLVLLFSPDKLPDPGQVKALSEIYPPFSSKRQACLDQAGPETPGDLIELFAFQYAYYYLLAAKGVEVSETLATGISALVVNVLSGKMTLEQAIPAIPHWEKNSSRFDLDKFSSYVVRLTSEKQVVFLEPGAGDGLSRGLLSAAIEKMFGAEKDPALIGPVAGIGDPFGATLAALYAAGVRIGWSKFYEGADVRKIEAPVYCFEQISCWEQDSLLRKQVQYSPMTNGHLQSMMEILKEALELDELHPEDDLFEMGLHSLVAAQVLNRISFRFGIRLEVGDLFNYPMVRDLAAHIGERVSNMEISGQWMIPPMPTMATYPLSDAQRRLWISEQMTTGRNTYNLSALYTFDSDFNQEAFRQAIQALIERHEILRTVFVTEEGEPRQKILPFTDMGFAIENRDLRREKNAGAMIREMAFIDATTPFDLEKGPLLRAKLLRTVDDKYIFLFTMHHIVTDGWSTEILAKEFAILYKNFFTGRENLLSPLRIQYKDYAGWQNDSLGPDKIEEHRAYWTKQFSGELPVLQLTPDYPRPPVKTFRGDNLVFMLPGDLSEKLNLFCRKRKVSLFMALVALVKTLLYRYSGQEEIIIGTTVANRDHVELEDQVGFYVNTLPLRTKFSGRESFLKLLETIRDNVLGVYKHQTYPFDLLVNDLNIPRDASRSPLFDILVELLNVGSPVSPDADVDDRSVTSSAQPVSVTQYDMSFRCRETAQGLFVNLEYNKDLFLYESIEVLKQGFCTIVQKVLDDPHVLLDDEFLLTAGSDEFENNEMLKEKSFSSIII